MILEKNPYTTNNSFNLVVKDPAAEMPRLLVANEDITVYKKIKISGNVTSGYIAEASGVDGDQFYVFNDGVLENPGIVTSSFEKSVENSVYPEVPIFNVKRIGVKVYKNAWRPIKECKGSKQCVVAQGIIPAGTPYIDIPKSDTIYTAKAVLDIASIEWPKKPNTIKKKLKNNPSDVPCN